MMGGPQGGIPPKTLGEILSAAFNIYKANASKLILIVAVVVVPLSFISALLAGVVFAGTKHTVTILDRQVVVTDRSFALFVTAPTPLRQRFDEYSAGIGLLVQGRALLIWLPDLGQDRDVDRGEAQEDIDSPDMAFRRVRPASQGVP